jgi:sugar lactone lactonase YvrE
MTFPYPHQPMKRSVSRGGLVLRGMGAIALLLGAACSSSSSDALDGGTTGGSGDASSTTGGSDAGTGGQLEAGSNEEASAEGGDCPTEGTGTVMIETVGLPAGLSANVALSGPGGADAAVSGANGSAPGGDAGISLPAGPYTITTGRVFDHDPTVRTVYVPTHGESSFCLQKDGTHAVQVAYAPIPTSNKLWVTNGPGGAAPILGFASATLAASGTPNASVVADAQGGRDVIFDRDGNLWAPGATLVEPNLVRFAAGDLVTPGPVIGDRAINLPSITCIPQVNGLAFDAAGNLWVSACNGVAARLSPAEIGASGDVTPSVTITFASEKNGDLAFDSAHNLWFGDDGKVARYDASRLSASTAAAADRIIAVTRPSSTTELLVDNPTFDRAGNLWAIDFGGNNVVEIAAADLTGTGSATVAAVVVIALDVGALLDRPAFDEGGGLWLSWSAGKFARLAPGQLGTSTTAGSPTVPEVIVASPDVGAANRMAFFPAPAGLPLFSAIP